MPPCGVVLSDVCRHKQSRSTTSYKCTDNTQKYMTYDFFLCRSSREGSRAPDLLVLHIRAGCWEK